LVSAQPSGKSSGAATGSGAGVGEGSGGGASMRAPAGSVAAAGVGSGEAGRRASDGAGGPGARSTAGTGRSSAWRVLLRVRLAAKFASNRASAQPACGRLAIPPRLSRARSVLLARKNGTVFLSTGTTSRVRGLCPMRALRRLTVKAPKPRNSTRSPRASAAVIWSKTSATISSASAWRRCGLWRRVLR
jgi:hypothetical protein